MAATGYDIGVMDGYRFPPNGSCTLRRLDRATAERHANLLLCFSADQEWENWTAENLLDERCRKWELSLIALCDDAPVGYAIISAPDEHHHHLHRIAVRPGARRAGVGQTLLKDALSRAQLEHVALTLKVLATNVEAIRFYERLNFQTLSSDERQILMTSPE